VTTLDQFAALRTPAGAAALAAATAVTTGAEDGAPDPGRAGSGTPSGEPDPLAAASELRRRGVPPELAAAALTQARLRRRGAGKHGPDAARMFFTRSGLEQSTRAVVAARRADRLAAAGVRTLADLGCGIGADMIAAVRAGIRVHAVEADPLTAAVAAANLAALGLAGEATVECGRAEAADLSAVDAVFCDPSRRHPGTGRRTFDPAGCSPPWDFVAALPGRVRQTVLKLAPGLDHARIPAGAEAQWVSVGGDLVEAALWCGPLAEVPRRATLLPAGAALTGPGDAPAPVGPVRRFLFDPDPAVVRAYLLAELAGTLAGNLADPRIGYLYADRARRTPYARCLEVREVLPFSLKRLRAALRAAGVGRVEILKRGSALVPERLRRDLRLSGGAAATVVLTRVAGAPTALLCQPVD
jgi:hypothetical protein